MPNRDDGQRLIHSGSLIHRRKYIYWLCSFDGYWLLTADEAVEAEIKGPAQGHTDVRAGL